MKRSTPYLATFVASLLLVLLGGAVSDVSAQSFCAIPMTPPAPPPPPQPPPYCTPKDCNKCTKSPCYVATGGYTNDFDDLQIWTRGLPISVSRHYESTRLVDGPIGLGWTFSLTPRLYYAVYLFSAPSTYSHEADILMADGSLLRFSEAGGVFSPTFGRNDHLVHNADGTFDLKPQTTRYTLHFNADGTMGTMIDAAGNSVSFTYDGNGRLASVQDDSGSGRSISVTWGSNGRIATLTDFTGRTVSYTYDASGSLTNVTNPKGQVTTMAYAPGRFAPHMTSIRDPWNRVISDMVWQSDDRLLSYTEGLYNGANSAGEKYTYGYSPGATTKTDSLATQFFFTDPNTFLASDAGHTYDNAGRPTLVTDGLSQVSYWYDAQGRVDKFAKGNVYWKYTYDANFPEQPTSLVAYNDFDGQNPNLDFAGTYLVYVPPGQPGAGAPQDIQQRRSDGLTKDTLIHYQYDNKGQLTSATDNDSRTSTFAYNAAGDMISVTAPAGTTQYGYDSLGRMTSKTNALGKITTYTYDELDRVASITLPKPSAASSLTFVSTFSYDNFDAASGLTFTQTTDPNGHITKVGLDALGHVVQDVDAANNVTTYNYKYNLLDTIVDANGNTTRFTYDGTRTRNGTVRPDGGIETFNSTTDGTMYYKLDARGVAVSYAYDAWGRVTSATWSKNGQFMESFTNTYAGQKLTSVAYLRGGVNDVVSYTYDTSYRVLTETQGTRAMITYNTQGLARDLLNGYTVGPVSGSGPTTSTSYSYDGAGRIATIAWSRVSGSFTFAYNAMGQFTNITFPDGQQRSYTYDDQGRLTQLTNTHPYGVFATFDYAYDHDWSTNTDTMKGQLTSVNVTASAGMAQRVGLTKYTYDVRNQLTRVDYPSGVELMTYDAIGNRQTYGGTPYSYFQNAAGGNSTRLKNDTYSGDYTYDANGNLLGLATAPNAQWDAHNRLLSVASSYTQAYDYSGRRITGKTASNTTSYVYDGLHVVSERNTAPASQTDYLFGPGIDQPLALADAQNLTSYNMTDGQGSIIGATEADGTIHNPVNYSAFGIPSSGTPGFFGYTGREYSGTGYTYFRARHYDPLHGRFTSEDPLNGMVPVVGGDLYSYAANSPAMNVDPMGLECKMSITHGIYSKTGEEWSQEWRLFHATITQVPIFVPASKAILGGRLPIWVKMIMTCDFNKYMRVTTHWTRKIRVHLECDCPNVATSWDDQQSMDDSYEFFLKGAETTSSWMMGAQMRPCSQP